MAEVLSAPAELTATTPGMIDAAAAVTARRMHLPTPEAALERLRVNDPTALSYFRYELARQVGELLLRYDRHVVALYEEQEVPDGEELAPPEISLHDPLRVYVLVEHATHALDQLLAALDDALTEALAARFGRPAARCLHAVVVEEAQAALIRPRARGYRPRPALILSRETASATSACSSGATKS
ncbi:MAG: hypothetical protein QJR03_05865 [Sphaerobacter sp.]|nr:hypothetical protein [Sphaerobacter sp.]